LLKARRLQERNPLVAGIGVVFIPYLSGTLERGRLPKLLSRLFSEMWCLLQKALPSAKIGNCRKTEKSLHEKRIRLNKSNFFSFCKTDN